MKKVFTLYLPCLFPFYMYNHLWSSFPSDLQTHTQCISHSDQRFKSLSFLVPFPIPYNLNVEPVPRVGNGSQTIVVGYDWRRSQGDSCVKAGWELQVCSWQPHFCVIHPCPESSACPQGRVWLLGLHCISPPCMFQKVVLKSLDCRPFENREWDSLGV